MYARPSVFASGASPQEQRAAAEPDVFGRVDEVAMTSLRIWDRAQQVIEHDSHPHISRCPGRTTDRPSGTKAFPGHADRISTNANVQ
jgi:hypothetical protein